MKGHRKNKHSRDSKGSMRTNFNRFAVFIVMASIAVLLFYGYGTICTAVDGHCGKLEPFSGTRAAAQEHGTQLDVPFSLIADVVLLPLTLPKALVEAACHDAERRQQRQKRRAVVQTAVILLNIPRWAYD
jgi:uncharacterized protein YceK